MWKGLCLACEKWSVSQTTHGDRQNFEICLPWIAILSEPTSIYGAFPKRGWVDLRKTASFPAQIFTILAIPCHSVGYNAKSTRPIARFPWFT